MIYDDKNDFRSRGLRSGALVESGALVLSRHYNSRGKLPYTPIWPGFAINSIFYAGVLCLLFAAPGKLRRWRRIKRGLCPACAYPVGESDLCTEWCACEGCTNVKRRLLKIAVLLVLGAILNVAVAWGLVLSQPLQAAIAVNIDIYPMFLSNHYENRQPSPAITWVIPERDQFRETRIGRGARLYQRFVGPRFIDQPDPRGLTEWRAAIGWPQLAVVTNWQSQDAFIELYLNTDRWLIRQARWPRFPGFAINTIFYAAILWLLFAAPVKLRRWRRIKRGLCPACAYPVGGSDICTECGGNLHSAPASRGKRGLQGAAAPCTRASDHNT